jgi:hypothetical protein
MRSSRLIRGERAENLLGSSPPSDMAAVSLKRQSKISETLSVKEKREASRTQKTEIGTKLQSWPAKLAPLGVAEMLWVHEVGAFGRRREGEGGLHGPGALHDRHLPLRGRRAAVRRQDVREPAGGAVHAEPASEVHARTHRGRLGVAQREAPEVRAGRRRPAAVLVVGAAVVPRLPTARRTRRRGQQRSEQGGWRRGGRGGELGARPGDEGGEEVVGAEGEADHLLVAVVVDEEHAHDLGGVVGVERVHPPEHGPGDLPCVHGAGGEASGAESGGRRGGKVGERRGAGWGGPVGSRL